MSGFLDDAAFDIPCPNCGQETKKGFGWIKGNSEFICACGAKIRLDTDQFRSEITKAEAAVKSLQDTIKKLNKQ
jgi:hypothetical protein